MISKVEGKGSTPKINIGDNHVETQRSSMGATDKHPKFRQRN